jgi:hypothetical protein
MVKTRKTVEVKWSDLHEARKSGEPWRSICSRYSGITSNTLRAVLKRKTDTTIHARPSRKPDSAVQVARVNRALAVVTSEQSIEEASTIFAERLRQLGVRKLVLDLEANTVEITRTETMPLRYAAA